MQFYNWKRLNMKKLVIVESPHKAHLIQEFLGDNYIVLASKGHITEIAKGGKWGIGIDIKNNFTPKYVLIPDKVSVLDEIMKAAKQCEIIYLCSDPDREGSMIGYQLKERLQDLNKPFKRATFNEIKKSIVLKAIKNAGDLDMNQVNSCKSRQVLDRIVGFSASPFLMRFFGPSLSAGRVQSVVTRMIVDREADIQAFIPEEYYTIQVNLAKNKEAFNTKYFGKLTDHPSASIIYNKLIDKSAEFIVSDVVAAEEPKYAPPPLITSTLQRIMSKEHGFDSEKTMKCAQSLYENGHVSYIRTDSVRSSDESIEEVRCWLADNNYLIPTKPNEYKNNDSAQDGHECIRPTDMSVLPKNSSIIDSDEKLVYETIWKYFVASQMLPAMYNTLKVSIQLKGDKSVILKASGKAIKSNGFLDIFGASDGSKIDIPNLVKGDELKLSGKIPVRLEKKQTNPPPRYSEDKLIKELDAKGIGRPATYAQLLGKITSRNYVEKINNIYHPTELGKKITEILVKQFTFLDYNYTKDMEKKLDLIANGKLDYVEMLKAFYDPFKIELDKAYLDNGGTLCEKCGSPMSIRTSKRTNEKFQGCNNYPRCLYTKPIE